MGLSLGEEGQEPGAGARPGRSRDGRAQTGRAGGSREDAARRGGPQCGPSITCARTLRRAPSCTAAPSPPTLTRLAPRPCPTHTTLIATFIFGPEIEPSICKSPSACSLQPTSHPASDRLPGCLPLSQSMVRTASNRLFVATIIR